MQRKRYICLLSKFSSEVSAYTRPQKTIGGVLCLASSKCFTAIREGMNNEHKRKDKEAFNKRGLEQNGGCEGGRAESWKARLRHETYGESDNGMERERYSLQLDLAEQGPLICKCATAVWMFDGCWGSACSEGQQSMKYTLQLQLHCLGKERCEAHTQMHARCSELSRSVTHTETHSMKDNSSGLCQKVWEFWAWEKWLFICYELCVCVFVFLLSCRS